MTSPRESCAEHLARWPAIRPIPTGKLEIFAVPGFINQGHCNALIGLIESGRRPSTLADSNGDNLFRTSETCDLPGSDPAVRELERRLFALCAIPSRYGEPIQGQRYAVGEEFKPHTDYFTPNGRDYQKWCSVAGQRSWTFMIYLNPVDGGGVTRFPALDRVFRPETGKLLCWNNCWPDGSVNPNTLHHGMKVRKGVKYIITKWYRERPLS